MKKILILTMAILIQTVAVAAPKEISFDQFEHEMKDLAGDGDSYIGSLEDINGAGDECRLKLVKESIDEMIIQLSTEKGLIFDLDVRRSHKIMMDFIGDEDFSVEYKWGYSEIGYTKELIWTHADDAYDSVILKYGNTSLVCLIEM